MPRREQLAKKGIHEDKRRLRSMPSGSGGGTSPHPLLGQYHSDTAIAAPVEGALVLADDTPEWNILLHPVAAGYAMVTDATTWTIDQTPTWTGDHTWDDGDGDSPALHLIPENDDDWQIWAENDATPGDSDLILKFPAANADSVFIFRDSGDGDVGGIDADGRGGFGTLPSYMLHVSGAGNPTAMIANPSNAAAIQVNAGGTGNNAQLYLVTDDQDWRFGNRGDASDAFIIRDHTNGNDVAVIATGAGTNRLTINASGDTGVNVSSASAQLHIDQDSSSGAQPALLIDQGDVSEQHIVVSMNGADQDFPAILQLNVTGDPTLWWDESENAWTITDEFALADGDLHLPTGKGVIHADGVAAGYVLLADGTRYIPAAASSNLPIAPGARGHIIRAEAGPVWASYNAATNGGVLIGNGTDIVSDTTPTLVGKLTFDDGAGDSPAIWFVGGSNDDTAKMYVDDDAVAGNSDFVLSLCADDADSQFQIKNASMATAAWIDATGDASFADVNIASGSGVIHADGVAAGYVLLGNGTRYVPAAANANLPVAPGARGHIIRAEAGPVWASYNAATLGGVLIGDGTDIISDTSPTLVGNLTLDDGAGDSPEIVFITGANDDEVAIWLDEDLAGAGASDLRVQLCDDAGASQFEIRDSGSTIVAYVTSDGDARFADVDINGNDLIIDTDGDTYLHASADDVVDLVLATASGEFGITINGAEDFTFTANSFNVASGSIIDVNSVVKVRSSGDLTTEADIWFGGNAGISAEGSLTVLIDSDNDSTTEIFEIAHNADKRESLISGVPLWAINEGGQVYQRLAAVDHGLGTTIFAHTDVFGQIEIADSSAGGLEISGGKDPDGGNYGAVVVRGFLDENVDTTKSTAGRSLIEIQGYQTNGAVAGNVVADGNVFGVQGLAGGSLDSLMIVDINGGIWANGVGNFATAGLRTITADDNVSSPPTDAQLDTAFGTPAAVGEGFIGLIDDANANTTAWVVYSIGGSWWYGATLTKAT